MAKRKRTPKHGECVYCGNFGVIEDDHVPPKNLFPPPRPSDLITVPACTKCHDQTDKDDEYFRLALIPRADVQRHPAAQRVWPIVHRSLYKWNKRGFTKAFTRTIYERPVTTPAGIYPGTVGTYDADLVRLRSVAQRIIKGLFCRERGIRLADAFAVTAYEVSGFSTTEARQTISGLAEALRARGQGRSIGNGVFRYWCVSSPTYPSVQSGACSSSNVVFCQENAVS